MAHSASSESFKSAPPLSLARMARQVALSGAWRKAGLCDLYAVEAKSWVAASLREDLAVTPVDTIQGLRQALGAAAVETILVSAGPEGGPSLPDAQLVRACEHSSLFKTVFHEVEQ